MSINTVQISGNLTRSPEIRTTPSGTPVTSFGIAVNERWKNQQTGEWEDHPNFIDCVWFGTRAQSACKFLDKGSKVFVTGKLRQSTWERDGQKRSKIEVMVNDLDFGFTNTVKKSRAEQTQMPGMPEEPAPNIYDIDYPF